MRGDRSQTHPLYGADPGTLWQVWRQANGRYLENGQKRLFHAFLAAAARLPFTLAESLYVAAAGAGSAQPEAPVFILGHWRSGTTHLYNVLSKAPHFARVADDVLAALEQGDSETAQRLAHTLKGLAGNVGASGLQEMNPLMPMPCNDSSASSGAYWKMTMPMRSASWKKSGSRCRVPGESSNWPASKNRSASMISRKH